jgi:YaiO family outer membrane protein
VIKKFQPTILAVLLWSFAGIANAEVAGSPAALATDSALATPNSVQLGYSFDTYSRYFEDNPITTLKYGRVVSWGSLSLQANSSHRFQTNDIQYEINLYPRLWKGLWAELNLGTSAGNLFALNSQGAEIFSSFDRGYEGSLGLRHLAFTNSAVTIYTGSVSKYAGNYLFTIRPYVTPSNVGTSISTTLSVTRYFADADSYWKISASAGKSPEERTYPPKIVTVRSSSFGVSAQWTPRKAIFISPSFNHARQELIFSPGEFVGVDKIAATVSYHFK